MKQEDRQLLLKELSARFIYKVKCHYKPEKDDDFDKECDFLIRAVDTDGYLIPTTLSFRHGYYIDNVKPYLRTIESMDDNEVDMLFKILKINEENGKEWIKVNDIGIIRLFTEEGKDFYEIADAMDYLNSIHIDYRDLIPKGLALEAPEGMYKRRKAIKC